MIFFNFTLLLEGIFQYKKGVCVGGGGGGGVKLSY